MVELRVCCSIVLTLIINQLQMITELDILKQLDNALMASVTLTCIDH